MTKAGGRWRAPRRPSLGEESREMGEAELDAGPTEATDGVPLLKGRETHGCS